MQDLLRQKLENARTPGVYYCFFDRESIRYQYRGGFADIASGRSVTEVTTFHAYSVTKTFTAVAILQLMEQGLLELDTPAQRYLPDFPYPADITLRHLLAHRAGIPSPMPLAWIHLAEEHAAFDRRAFFDPIFEKYPRTRFAPDRRFAYSNLGYVLLGRVIEAVSGLSYEDYVRQHIIGRLGLPPGHLGFQITDPARHATGYHHRGNLMYWLLGFFLDKKKYLGAPAGSWASFRPNYVNDPAYGGLVGTANGFVAYVQDLLRPGGTLLRESSRALLWEESRSPRMCLAWFAGNLNGIPYRCHAGGGGGYYCEIRAYPALGLGSVVMMNRSGMSDERFLDKVDRYLI